MNTRWPRSLSCVIVAALSSAFLIGCGSDEHGRNCPGHAGKDLSGRTVDGSDLWQKKMRCIRLEGSTLTGSVSEANLRHGNLYKARLTGASLENVDLRDADLRRADLSSATLSEVDLRGADLSGAALGRSLLTDVSFDGAHLGDTDLRAASLTHVGLADADLRGADLAGATLSDSDLRGARVRKADVTETSWENVVCPDGSRSTPGGSCLDHLTRAAGPSGRRGHAGTSPGDGREHPLIGWCRPPTARG